MKKPNAITFINLQNELKEHFHILSNIQKEIKDKLEIYADGKILKGNELVGWLGEIYIKLLYDGRLVDDKYEHDVELQSGERISVKTRKGRNENWNRTSAIPKIEGDGIPTHLAFVNLDEKYQVYKIWLYPWEEMYKENRFKEHIVRKQHRSFVFFVNEKDDKKYEILL